MTYDAKFFEYVTQQARSSARILKAVRDEIGGIETLIDVGCGQGAWLQVADEIGIPYSVGLDGDYIDRENFCVDPRRFNAIDLSEHFSVEKRFDAALCLEVAEHLPEHRADGLVSDLCDLSPYVIFSAAVPFQGGEGHINERWPHYWMSKFAAHDYIPSGFFRWHFWDDESIAWFYRQNLIVFGAKSSCEFRDAWTSPYANFTMSLVHPELYGSKMGVKFLL